VTQVAFPPQPAEQRKEKREGLSTPNNGKTKGPKKTKKKEERNKADRLLGFVMSDSFVHQFR
jgi:hypothetical protein